MLAYLSSHRKSMKLKSEKAITLIALVITILVLLLLGGITIGVLSGENGAIKNAISARKQTKIAEEYEALQIAATLAYGDNLKKDIDKDVLETYLENRLKKDITLELADGKYIYEGENSKYLIDKKRKCTSIRR